MNGEKILFAVRHGIEGGEGGLSKEGYKQIHSLRQVIDNFITKAFGKKEVTRIYFSFSTLAETFQSAQELKIYGDDIVVTNLYLTKREEIPEPQKILGKVMRVANCYGASVIVIVAHGEMPAVIVETAYELVKRERFTNKLPNPGHACGYTISLNTGEVTHIRFDD